MDLVKRMEVWKAEHITSKLLAGLRIILGLIILFKGIVFVQNTGAVQSMLANSRFEFGSMALAHYIAMVHLAGGLMIALGFLTRIAVIFQLPILIGAVIFVNINRGVFMIYSELLFSIIVLLMLLFFLFYGPGIYSADTMLKRKRFSE